jgi:uncharacterized protein with von Willebrand factor type A (vWA) domain
VIATAAASPTRLDAEAVVIRFRYTSWDGTQQIRLDPDEIFERLADYLSETDDLSDALDRLMRSGMRGREFEVVGLDEMLARVRAAMQEIYESYDLDHALDEHRRRLDELLEDEEVATGDLADERERSLRERFLSRMPRALDDAFARLTHHGFLDREAAAAFEALAEDADDVRRLSDFIRRHGDLFVGPTALDFDEALELLDRLDALRRLEEQILNRDLDAIDADEAAELLGQELAEAVGQLREMLAVLGEAGYVVPKGGRIVLTPKGARKLGRLALREIHESLVYDAGGRHETTAHGPMEISSEETKRYDFGDPLNVDVVGTVKNAVRRSAGVPVSLGVEDFEVFRTHNDTRNATVLLLDMSWSMSWEGRFAAAKKVALAMETLMRSRFPRDYFGMVGFYTRAVELKVQDLPEVTWNMGDPFTNLQDGLRMASRLLERQPGRNKNVIVITDGQPTAYFSGGRLFCEWPMSLGGLSTRATMETLKEVERVTRKGVRINTFMLDDSPALRSFVERMTAINRGRAFYTTPDQLGRFLLVDYVARRRRVL